MEAKNPIARKLSAGVVLLALMLAACSPVEFAGLNQNKGNNNGGINPGGTGPGGSGPGGGGPGGGAPGGSGPGGGGPGGSGPGGSTPNYDPRCGGPADPMLYTPYVELAKVQSNQYYATYADCQAARAAIFANAMVCSKMVSATILGCLPSADMSRVVMEITVALPVLKATGRMEVPYDYFLLGVPRCDVARDFINSTMNATVTTNGNFTHTRAHIRADCRSATEVILHVLDIF